MPRSSFGAYSEIVALELASLSNDEITNGLLPKGLSGVKASEMSAGTENSSSPTLRSAHRGGASSSSGPIAGECLSIRSPRTRPAAILLAGLMDMTCTKSSFRSARRCVVRKVSMDTGSAGSASLSNCATTVTARRTWGCSVASASSVDVVAGVVSSFCAKRVSLALVDDAVQLVFTRRDPALARRGLVTSGWENTDQ